jgi:hypothetical protein
VHNFSDSICAGKRNESQTRPIPDRHQTRLLRREEPGLADVVFGKISAVEVVDHVEAVAGNAQ